jgi:hypothetical protein
MKQFKNKTVEVLDDLICDICGESCKDKNFGYESANISATWGYASNQDGSKYDIDLCENCFEKTLDFLQGLRKVKPAGKDPLDPRPYAY